MTRFMSIQPDTSSFLAPSVFTNFGMEHCNIWTPRQKQEYIGLESHGTPHDFPCLRGKHHLSNIGGASQELHMVFHDSYAIETVLQVDPIFRNP